MRQVHGGSAWSRKGDHAPVARAAWLAVEREVGIEAWQGFSGLHPAGCGWAAVRLNWPAHKSQRGEHGVIEAAGSSEITASDGDVAEHWYDHL